MEQQPIDLPPLPPLTQSELSTELMGHLYDFFENIKHKKGFTFTRDVRVRELRSENLSINWSTDQKQFKYNKEREYQKIEKVVEENNFLGNKKERQVFGQVVLLTSCLFDEESTSEFYIMMREVWVITGKNLVSDETRKLEIANLSSRVSTNFNQLYPFFSFNFSGHYNVNRQLLERQLQQFLWKTSQSFILNIKWCRINSEH